MKRKKTYRSPIIEMVEIDRAMVLLQTSEGTGPGHPDPDTVSPQQNSSTPNKFNENPFEK